LSCEKEEAGAAQNPMTPPLVQRRSSGGFSFVLLPGVVREHLETVVRPSYLSEWSRPGRISDHKNCAVSDGVSGATSSSPWQAMARGDLPPLLLRCTSGAMPFSFFAEQ